MPNERWRLISGPHDSGTKDGVGKTGQHRPNWKQNILEDEKKSSYDVSYFVLRPSPFWFLVHIVSRYVFHRFVDLLNASSALLEYAVKLDICDSAFRFFHWNKMKLRSNPERNNLHSFWFRIGGSNHPFVGGEPETTFTASDFESVARITLSLVESRYGLHDLWFQSSFWRALSRGKL